jgi:predicted chitinase
LFDLLDEDGSKQLSPIELRRGWEKPWLAQTLSRQIIEHPSEWGLEKSKWEALDEYMKESDESAVVSAIRFLVVWEEDKKRIEKLQFWKEVKGQHGFPEDIKVWHIHPLGLVENFINSRCLICKDCGATITLTEEFLKHADVAPHASQAFIDALVKCSAELFSKYGVNTCNQVTHLLAQAKVETKKFTAFRESLYYSRAKYGNGGLYPVGAVKRLYNMAPTTIDNGFSRKGINFTSLHDKYVWCDTHLIENDAGYAEHCYGSNLHPGKNYRGRGLLHLTHFDHYEKAAQATGFPVDSQPELVESDMRVIIETGLWFWNWKSLPTIGKIQDIANNPGNPANAGNAGVRLITKLVTGSETQALAERQLYKRQISPIFNEMFNGCADVTDV